MPIQAYSHRLTALKAQIHTSLGRQAQESIEPGAFSPERARHMLGMGWGGHARNGAICLALSGLGTCGESKGLGLQPRLVWIRAFSAKGLGAQQA